MNKEEIKEKYSMVDILQRYGLKPNRSGLIHCPFHKEKHASMKIYKKDFNCFGCGTNGDIFTFVQKMEGLSFQDAFYSLGGIYEKPTFSSRLAIYRSQKQREMRKKEEERKRMERNLNNQLITIYRKYVQNSEPLSDTWCDCYNSLQYQLYLHEILNEPR